MADRESTIYKGTLPLGFRGVMSVLYLGSFIGILTQEYSNPLEVCACCFFSLLSILALFYVSHYFIISNDVLVVRNHYKFWLKRIYNFDDILEVAFEQRSKMPGSIRITTKDNKSKLYPAETLSDSKWIDLKDELEKKQLPIRDEFVSAIVLFEFVVFKEIREIFSRFKKNER